MQYYICSVSPNEKATGLFECIKCSVSDNEHQFKSISKCDICLHIILLKSFILEKLPGLVNELHRYEALYLILE